VKKVLSANPAGGYNAVGSQNQVPGHDLSQSQNFCFQKSTPAYDLRNRSDRKMIASALYLKCPQPRERLAEWVRQLVAIADDPGKLWRSEPDSLARIALLLGRPDLAERFNSLCTNANSTPVTPQSAPSSEK